MRNTQQKISQACFKHLVGIPHSEKDCFQLVKDFYAVVYGTELKHYYDDTPKDSTEVRDLIYTNMGDFERVEVPEFGDIVLLKIRGIERHLGVYIDGGQLFHTLERTGSVIDRLDRWKTNVTGYYRARKTNVKD